MPQFVVELHPLAADEAQAAERWYRERNEIAAGRFQRENSTGRLSGFPSSPKPGLRISVAQGAYYCAAFRFSSCIAHAATIFTSSPLRRHGGGRDTGECAEESSPWFENPSPRPHVESHSQPHVEQRPRHCRAWRNRGSPSRYAHHARRGATVRCPTSWRQSDRSRTIVVLGGRPTRLERRA
jgi:hypothetical protein